MSAARGSTLRRGLAVSGLLLFAALMLLRPLPASVGQPVAYLVQVVTVALAVRGVLRLGLASTGPLRRARLLVAAALSAGAAAGVLATVIHLATGAPPPVPSVADVVHMAWLPLVVVALASYPVTCSRAGSRLSALLDGLVAATALWLLAAVLVLDPAHVGEGLGPLARTTTLLYPAGDVLVLGMLGGVLARVDPAARRELVLTGAGLALYVLSDLAYTVHAAQGTYRADSWVSVLAEAGLLLVLAGTRRRTGPPAPLTSPDRVLRALPWLPLLLVGVVGLARAAGGGGLSPGQLATCAVLVTALVLRLLVAGRDHAALLQRLQAREELWRALVVGASDHVTLHTADGDVLYASPALGRALGTDAAELVGSRLRDRIHPSDQPALLAVWRDVLAEPGAAGELTCRLEVAPGQWRWMHTHVHNRLDDASVGGVVVSSRDVHERKVLEGRLTQAAYRDALTGLANRAQAAELLEQRCAARLPTTVVLIDLDGFKAVNDTYGHARGDVLLEAVAERLRGCVRGGDDVARIGGDEFLLLLDGTDRGAATAQQVLAAVSRPVDVAGAWLQVGASIGLATSDDAASPDDLLRNADLAMYASKEAGRDRATAYQPRMHEAAAHRMRISRGLRRALDDGHLVLHYQPIVALPGGALVGAEALLRWDDPEDGRVPPDVFIPVAEESGLIGEIDLWVLDRACADLAGWRRAGLVAPAVSVNVSRRQLTGELPRVVAAALARHGLAGPDLCVEVTESAVVRDAAAAAAALEAVRALGVQVALDDFGTGQSSLSQLARLPVDTVKIDRSFTSPALHDQGARRLLTSIVRVCQALQLPVVAEGIEHAEVAELLAAVGCGRGQGWHFGRPEEPAAFAARLARPHIPGARTASDSSTRTPA